MFSRIFSLLIEGGLDLVEKTKAKILVSLLLVALAYCFFALLCLDAIQSDFPNGLLAISIIGLLLLLKVTRSVSLVGNLLAIMIFLTTAITSFKSGGIYSHDLPALSIVVLLSFCLLGIKETLFYCVVSLTFISYSYYQGLDAEKLSQFNLQRNQFNIEYYLVISSLTILLPTVFYSVLSNMNSRLINDLSIANKKLDRINNDLAQKSDKLAEAKSKLVISNDQLEKYAHAASHDLKQPLRTIISFTQLMGRKLDKLGIEDDGIADYMNHVISGTKRMESQVEDLLSFSSVDQKGHKETIDLNQLLTEVRLDLSALIEKNKASLRIGYLPTVTANRSTISQVIQNLITNAIKYKKVDSDVIINISSESIGDMATICIADNGIGIEQKNLTNVFDRFFQENDVIEGKGIGLDTCKHIIESHYGKIWVDSTIGIGSKFYFTLPLLEL